jgi:hypothetical protein
VIRSTLDIIEIGRFWPIASLADWAAWASDGRKVSLVRVRKRRGEARYRVEMTLSSMDPRSIKGIVFSSRVSLASQH